MNDSSEYYRRIKIALKWSAGLHLAVLIMALLWPAAKRPLTLVPPEPAYVFTLQPSTPGHFVETATPTSEPVGPTDLIAMHDSKAQDLSDVDGSRQAPHFDKPSDFDQLASVPAPMAAPPAPPVPSPAPLVQAPVREAENAAPKSEPERIANVSKPTSPVPADAAVLASKPASEFRPIAQQPPSGPVELAQPLPGTPPGLPPGESRGRVDGGVKNKGVLGFEAAEHEIAPYMKEIRSRVERNWRSALQMKYSGTQPTAAVLDCAIAPDGAVAYVNIVDAGSSATYAPLCKEAIEKAGPFPAFPFKVPDVYRSQNLEIRWTFSFLED